MKITFELRENEKIEFEVAGDLWEKNVAFLDSARRGKVWFTNQRVVFCTGALSLYSKPYCVIEYSDIESIEKCNIGPSFIKIIPTGIKIATKDGKEYKFSILKEKNTWSSLIVKYNNKFK